MDAYDWIIAYLSQIQCHKFEVKFKIRVINRNMPTINFIGNAFQITRKSQEMIQR